MTWKVTTQFWIVLGVIAAVVLLVNTGVLVYFFSEENETKDNSNIILYTGTKNFVAELGKQLEIKDNRITIKAQGIEELKAYDAWIVIYDENGKKVSGFNAPEESSGDFKGTVVYVSEDKEASQGRSGMVFESTPPKDAPIVVDEKASQSIRGSKAQIFAANGSDSLIMGSSERIKGLNYIVVAQAYQIESTRGMFAVGLPYSKSRDYTFYYSMASTISLWKKGMHVILFLTLFTVVVLGYLFSRWLSRPVIDITEGIVLLGQGKNDIQWAEKGLYKELYAGLNQLSKALAANEIERKRMEKMREEWFANTSHDLKTPLSSIKGYAEILAEPKYGMVTKEAQGYVDVILKNSVYMETLLQDLMLACKLKNNILRVHKNKCDIVEILREIIIDILNNPTYGNRKINFDADEAVIFLLDPILIKRAFTNIIFNAISHNPEDTVVTVRVIGTAKLHIEVEDNGDGIPDEDINNLFERYYKGTNTKGENCGSGLGLAISKQIIEAHGGKISIESVIGRGTKVIVNFTH